MSAAKLIAPFGLQLLGAQNALLHVPSLLLEFFFWHFNISDIYVQQKKPIEIEIGMLNKSFHQHHSTPLTPRWVEI